MIDLLFVMNTPLIGGAERHTFDIADNLRQFGFTSTVFAMKAGPLRPPEKVDLLQPARPRTLASRILDLAATIRARRPALIVTVNERPVFAGFVARKIAKATTPIVSISHSTVLLSRREELMQLVYTPLFNRVENVVFVSTRQAAHWRAHGFRPRHETVIPNGVDVDRFTPARHQAFRADMRRTLGFAADDLVLGLCAVMRPEKNHPQLVDAVGRLRQAGFPVKGLFVGDGPMRAPLVERIRAAGLGDHFVFAGQHLDVRPYVSAFDIGVLCSVRIETLSLAALEIMAMGVPMVMSDIGGAAEIVDGRNGLLFPLGDTTAFTDRLVEFMDPAARASAARAARETVVRHFNHETMIGAYADHFGAIVSGAGRSLHAVNPG